ncbi:copper chaperone PCu(A)C [Meiothermus ruber]|jgi:copper(I)-binding protein|uniref:Copper chaperone PCu(A)C n=1 Tax=Meiothermus ruber (strain ATCC 35948 / DSM 1279 / VKM B-1258 / 21) TaxID=504728 RepID=A0A806D1A8_MEIRD|nr:copper chaperone PCu(A)C [Meiothermus ruber]ADD29628.1 protein of unknown function DUF461 [Meiothermus ruber DSM 1279]GAO76543.1 putative uncharacterized protein [Meiothermus ruber H328]
MLRTILVLLSLVGLTGLAQAALKAENPWVRLVPGSVSGAFMTLANPSDKAIRVIAVESPIAGKVEIHQTTIVKGAGGTEVMQMRPVQFLEIPAKGRVELKPGGYHIMLMMLKEPLQEGKIVRITLRLEGGGALVVEAPVKAQ